MKTHRLWLILSLMLLSPLLHAESSMQETHAIFDAIEKNRDRHIEFLRRLVQSSKDGEEAVQSVVAQRFQELRCKVQTLKLLPTRLSPEKEFAAAETIDRTERISVMGHFEGTGGGKSLLFFGHPDPEPFTSESKKGWVRDPFAAVIEGGRIYGWGVADDLAGVAIMTEALDAVLAVEGPPKGDVYLASTPAKRNARGILALLNEGYTADASVYLHPAESEKGLRDLKAITSGMLQFRIKVSGQAPDTKEPGHTAFAHLAESAVEKARLVMEALMDLGDERAERVHHPAMEAAVGRSTNLLISQVRCGEGNRLTRVPTECVIGASLTFPPNEEMRSVQGELEETVKRAAGSDPWLQRHRPSIEWLFGAQGVEVPEDHALYRMVARAVTQVTGQEPEVNPLHSASDIRNPMLFRGIPSVGLGPLAGDFTQAGGHDEWVDVDDYIRAIQICAQIIVDWCY